MNIKATCSGCDKEIFITPAQYENFHDCYCDDCCKKNGFWCDDDVLTIERRARRGIEYIDKILGGKQDE